MRVGGQTLSRRGFARQRWRAWIETHLDDYAPDGVVGSPASYVERGLKQTLSALRTTGAPINGNVWIETCLYCSIDRATPTAVNDLG